MKDKSLISKVMHFLVHNSFMFTVAVMALTHMVLLGVMLYTGIRELISFNILSIIVYLFCVLLCKFGHIMPVYISVITEVSAYSIFSIHYLGWDCGSCCFLMGIVPVIIYVGCFLFKGTKRWIIVMILALVFALYTALFLKYSGTAPVYEISALLKCIFIIFSSFVMFFAVVFYNAVYIYSSESEMSDLEQENEQLTVDAKEDALTGLLNRRGFLPVVEDFMNNDDKKKFCVAFCDIDNFKRINDTYGHDCGDEVLRHIAHTLKKEIPGSDVCRWGGEEMVVFMKDYNFSAAKHKMEEVRKYIELNPTIFYNKRIPATITIGLEEYVSKYEKPEDIIKVADERMYYGKQHGKNILIFVDAS